MDNDLSAAAESVAAKHGQDIAESLQQYTSARVSLGQAGPAIPTREQLRFQLDHALARDAVHAQLDVTAMLQGLEQRKMVCLALRSAIGAEPGDHRQLYLRRPDLGRTLHPDSRETLLQSATSAAKNLDAVFVIADGLSALAVERHALPLLDALLDITKRFHPAEQWSIGPVCVVSQGRVAIADEIGDLLHARLSIVLIGERPGLSAPDSLGVYITWNPRPGRTDAERNCISNIRRDGLSYGDAAQRIAFYMNEAKRLQATGVTLKENLSLLGETLIP
jgi:ethanolamine ammonia-lyase small subunit